MLQGTMSQIRSVAAPVRQQVLESIRAAIVGGRFRPGQRLVERELCTLLGVSRPSVREALRQLESEGLVFSVPNRGPVVAVLDREHAAGIYEVRASLEGLAARLFAERANAEQVASLNAAFDELAKATSAEDVAQAVVVKDRFYEILLDGARNPMIRGILSQMNARITFLRGISLSSPKRLPAMLREIKAIVVAIRRRDGAGAERAAITHVNNAAEMALQALETKTVAAPAAAPGR
jgi:GntR family transcriptional regulator, trigonelline degradation regulator